MSRFRRSTLVSCMVPWSDGSFLETSFRNEIRRAIGWGFRHLYVFGTAGEGYAVTVAQFARVAEVFREETSDAPTTGMVGVIAPSTPLVLERLRLAHDIGFREFQISLPSWGELRAPEIDRFFDDVCGAFPDSSFLHYNLPRARRVLGAGDYQRLIERVPNLVATKTTSGGISVATDLVRHAGELEHYLGEGNFAHGAMNGGCSLLAGYAWLDADRTKRYFAAGLAQDAGVLAEMQMYYYRLGVDLFGWDAGPRIDGAYDKVVVRLGGFEEMPLELLSPYLGFTESEFRRIRDIYEARSV